MAGEIEAIEKDVDLSRRAVGGRHGQAR